MGCTGRCHDFAFRDDGEWTLVRKQPVYEKDRLDVAAASFKPAPELLTRLPFGYRHLGYVQAVSTGLVTGVSEACGRRAARTRIQEWRSAPPVAFWTARSRTREPSPTARQRWGVPPG